MASESVHVRALGYQILALKFLLNSVKEKFMCFEAASRLLNHITI
jgi:hypothetical protein